LADKPAVPFRVPAGIKLIRIDPKSGMRAGPGDQRVILEAFKPGTAPPDNYSTIGVSDADGRPVGVSPEADRAIRTGTGGVDLPPSPRSGAHPRDLARSPKRSIVDDLVTTWRALGLADRDRCHWPGFPTESREHRPRAGNLKPMCWSRGRARPENFLPRCRIWAGSNVIV